jgi:catechol-2,3-dioxygenase
MDNAGALSHIEIYVSDLGKTCRFWELLLIENLGYSIFQEWDLGVSYIMDGTYIVFVQTDNNVLSYNRTAVGLNHMAFTAPTNREVDQIRLRLIQAGYIELYSQRYPHAGGVDSYAAYFEDPDRIKVEIVAQKE